MISRVLLVVLFFGLLGDAGAEQGREGNVLFEQGRYAAAEAAYRRGLAAREDTTGAVYSALQNNLGAALLRQEEYESARAAFRQARRTASEESARVRALFNEGTAAAGAGDVRSALRRYRRVLLLDPTHEAARHNYELLKRRQAHPDRRPESSDVDPSPYARQLKKKAEALVARRQYGKAAVLLRDGLQQDSTVRAYRDFLGRIDDIDQIDQDP